MINNNFSSRNGVSSSRGFTFVELLVVITIIGVIFSSAIVAYTSITVRSRDTKRRTDLEAIRQSLEMCRSLTGEYPTAIYSAGGISCSVTGPILLAVVPTDPKPSTNCDLLYAYDRLTTTSYTLTACQEVGGNYQVASP
ncbi:MAG: hypothetical protein ACD_58C00311G0004 [uncultured bacterium]|nr:MAG: hypothetical protein ACD_58C00311G0004 [uncultured bacterium]